MNMSDEIQKSAENFDIEAIQHFRLPSLLAIRTLSVVDCMISGATIHPRSISVPYQQLQKPRCKAPVCTKRQVVKMFMNLILVSNKGFDQLS